MVPAVSVRTVFDGSLILGSHEPSQVQVCLYVSTRFPAQVVDPVNPGTWVVERCLTRLTGVLQGCEEFLCPRVLTPFVSFFCCSAVQCSQRRLCRVSAVRGQQVGLDFVVQVQTKVYAFKGQSGARLSTAPGVLAEKGLYKGQVIG